MLIISFDNFYKILHENIKYRTENKKIDMKSNNEEGCVKPGYGE